MGNAATSSSIIRNNTDEILKIVCWDKNGRETSQIVRKAESWLMTIPCGSMTITAFILASGSPVINMSEATLSTAESCYDFSVEKVDGLLNITQDIHCERKGQSLPRIRNSTDEALRIICTDKYSRESHQIVTSQTTWEPYVQSGILTVFASPIHSSSTGEESAVYTANSWDVFTVKKVEGCLNIELG